jgi:protocatechuate 3,4-dioxygenase beta subunit
MKFSFPHAYCALLAIVLAAQASLTQTPSKESENCTVQGQVVLEPGGQPLKKATIQMFSEDHEDKSYTTLTDSEGHFKIEDVKPGRYNVRIERNGFLEAGKHRGRFYSQPLTLKRGQEVKDLVFRMQPAAVITGKIVDAEGDPALEASVEVLHQRSGSSRGNSQFYGQARTNDLGEYRIPGLPPGRYLVLAQAQWPSPATASTGNESTSSSKTETVYAPTYYPGTMYKTQAAAIELHAGDQVPANISLVASHSFRIRGTVSGLPIALGSEIGIQANSETDSDTSRYGPEGMIAKDGTFEIRDVLPGSYTLSLTVSGDGRFPQEIRTAQTVEVTNTDVDRLRVVPAPSGQVHGQFRMDSGQKVDWSQTAVDLDSDEDSDSAGRSYHSWSHSDEVKGDGSFELKNVPAGSYHLVAESRAQALRDYFVKSVNLGSKNVAATGFTTGGANYSLDIVLSAKGATLEGAVLDGKDQPVVDAEVVAIPNAARHKRRDLYKQDSTDQRGHFTLRGLNPGQYTVVAFEDLEDYDYRDPDFIKSYEGRGQSVEIKEGERKSVLLKVVPSTDEPP